MKHSNNRSPSFFSKSDLESCTDPEKFKCEENYRFKDCGQLKDSQFQSFGCQHVDSETRDYFDCSNRIDKATILFKEPPVPKNTTFQSDNYNEILTFNDEDIHCGEFNISWADFKQMSERNGSKHCLLNNGNKVTISDLWIDLKADFSFKMSPKITQL